jgi:hypothetical protein
MKKNLILFTLLLSAACYSQKARPITIEWIDNKPISYGDYTVNVPQFKTDSYNYNDSKKEIQFLLKIPTANFINENSLQLFDVVYETISENQLGELNKTTLSSSLNASLSNIIGRDNITALLKLNPIIKEENNYKRVISFNYSFTESDNSNANILTNKAQLISNSVLSTGKWYRFYIKKSGVYKISKSFLEDLGIRTNTINPKKIKLYGNGGRMVPLSNSADYPIDLAENAIQVIGEDDASFDASDYILFYGEGVDNWSDENKTNLNLYSDKSYYYINTDGSEGKRIVEMTQPTNTPTLEINTFDDLQFHELDLNNIGRLGRIWFGESFSSNNEQEFEFNFPNTTSSNASLEVHVGGNSFVTTKFDIAANEQALSPITLSGIAINSGIEASHGTLFSTIPSSENITIKVTFDNAGVPASKGYLDFIKINAKRNLIGFNKQFRFQNNQTATLTGIGQYTITNATNINQIWDITDIYSVSNTINTNQASIVFKSDLGELKKYIAIDPNDYYTPLKESKSTVVNQDLKGTIFNDSSGNFQDIDYLIITPSNLNAQAEKLANFHRTYSQLNVKVVNLETIYQEFSSGKQDIGAIRNFVRYVYQNASTNSKRVKYLNLFGDASYDFKDRISNNTNIVPIYHSTNSYTSGESSFASDDFFVMMDNNEGNVEITNGNVILLWEE